MSLSWNFLTKPFIGLRYRELIAGSVIGMYGARTIIDYATESEDADNVMTRVYCHDESNIKWREVNNETDTAVRRQKLIQFSNFIKAERAKQERKQQLEAYNYLFGKNLELWAKRNTVGGGRITPNGR